MTVYNGNGVAIIELAQASRVEQLAWGVKPQAARMTILVAGKTQRIDCEQLRARIQQLQAICDRKAVA